MGIRSTCFRVKSVDKFIDFCGFVALTPVVVGEDLDGSGLVMFFSTDLDCPPETYFHMEGDTEVPIDFDEELKKLLEPGQAVKYEVVYAVCIRPSGEVEIEEPDYPELEKFLEAKNGK